MELKNTYKSKIAEKKVSSDIFYASIHNNTSQTDTLSKKISSRFIQFYFCTKGKANFHFSTQYSRVLEEGNSFLIYQPSKDIPLQISISAKSKLKILIMSIVELHHLFSSEVIQDFFQDLSTHVQEEHSINPDLHLIFNQLDQSPINPALEEVYWRNKISELMVLYFSQKMEMDSSCPYIENEELAQQTRKAKNLLLSNLKDFKTNSEIAQEVGLSEYKLKESFKKMYGSTLTQYAVQHKMQVGKEQIEKRNKKIKDIAQELGYENPSHFIEAFKKQYGITPKQYEMTLM